MSPAVAPREPSSVAGPPSDLVASRTAAPATRERISRTSVRLALLYALFGALWIALVDYVLGIVISDPVSRRIIGAYADWVLVAATAVGIYALIRRELRSRLQTEDQLRRREQRFRALVQHSADVIFLLEGDGAIRYVSPNVETVLGYRPEESVQPNLLELLHADDRLEAGRLLEELAAHPDATTTLEARALHADGEYRSLEIWGKNLLHDPTVAGYVLNARDATERKKFEAEIQRLAFYDALTGLANRRLLRERAKHSLSMARRHNHAAALLYLDLDRFKAVNDTLGHDAGDELLREVATRLGGSIRESDTLARLGGDEFAIMLSEIREEEDAAIVARRIVDALQQSVWIQQHPVHIGTSVGIAIFPHDGETYEELTKHADIAMYRAKAEKSGFQFFRPELSVYTSDRLLLEEEFRHTVENDGLRLAYQPILSLPGREIVGLEALARWPHPRRGEVPPAEFVPLAEETGVIGALDRWVISRAVRCDPGEWNGWIAINLSSRSLSDSTIAPYIEQEIRAAGIDPERLVVEITESAAMRNPEAAAEQLHALKRIGVQVALDDFGMGYSSLAYLKLFPIDILKLDKSFVSGVGAEVKDERLVEAVIRLAHGLGVQVLAEGVEHQRQLNFLMAEACDLVQGFLIGHPRPLDELRGTLSGGESLPEAPAVTLRPFPEF